MPERQALEAQRRADRQRAQVANEIPIVQPVIEGADQNIELLYDRNNQEIQVNNLENIDNQPVLEHNPDLNLANMAEQPQVAVNHFKYPPTFSGSTNENDPKYINIREFVKKFQIYAQLKNFHNDVGQIFLNLPTFLTDTAFHWFSNLVQADYAAPNDIYEALIEVFDRPPALCGQTFTALLRTKME